MPMIQRAVILAAGRGGSPLVVVGEEPLLYRNIRELAAIGVTEIALVVGYRGDEIRTALDAMPLVGGMRIQIVDNPDWRLTSGISLLAARTHVSERCFCVLGDRLVHGEALRPLAALDADAVEC